MNKLIYKNYNFKLIELMLKMSFSASIIGNIFAPLTIAYVVYGYLSDTLLFVWFLLHLLLCIFRIFLGSKLLKILNVDNNLTNRYLYIFYMILFFSAILNGIIIWLSVLNSIPASEILVLATILVVLSAGALSTLSSVFIGYIIYLSVTMLLLISAIIYHGGEMFYIFAANLIIFFIIFIIAGYRHHIALRKAISLEDTFENIYNNSSDGIVILENNRFNSCNMSILKMFKFNTKDDLLTTKLSYLSPKYQPDGKLSVVKMMRMIKKATLDGSHDFEWLHTRTDGEEFWCEIVLTKINLEGKDFIHGAWRDITQRKELEFLDIRNKEELQRKIDEAVKHNMIKDRQLLHQSRLAQIGEMIGMIAHQWRQPLSAISSTSISIGVKSELGTLDDETAQKLSEDINFYTRHLSDTIDDFRSFFKPNLEKEYTNYEELLKGVLGIIEGSIKNKKIELIRDIKCSEELYVFPNELKQVILNLVKNAEDILLENKIDNPYIKISSYFYEDNCILEVKDNGGGVKKEIIDKIFDPYFSTKLKKDGTGMGLYMSKIIVEEHCSGKLSVFNGDDGAIFKIEIKKADS